MCLDGFQITVVQKTLFQLFTLVFIKTPLARKTHLDMLANWSIFSHKALFISNVGVVDRY